jgi:hypothetical protein
MEANNRNTSCGGKKTLDLVEDLLFPWLLTLCRSYKVYGSPASLQFEPLQWQRKLPRCKLRAPEDRQRNMEVRSTSILLHCIINETRCGFATFLLVYVTLHVLFFFFVIQIVPVRALFFAMCSPKTIV